VNRALFVPVRRHKAGASLRLFTTPAGVRTAIAFSSADRLRNVLGHRQGWIRLTGPVLASLVEELGAVRVVVDPTGVVRRRNRRSARRDGRSSGRRFPPGGRERREVTEPHDDRLS
jgi:hypothetical protein